LEQLFIKDDKLSIQKLLDETSKSLGDTVKVVRFVRFQIGEKVST
jgi:translation elongation factor EF-Ts